MTDPGPDTAPDAPEPAQADTDARERSARRDQIAKAVLDFHGRENPTVSDWALAYGTADAILNRVAIEWWEHQCAAAVPAGARETLRERIEAALAEAEQRHLADTADRRVQITTALGLRLVRRWDDVLDRARSIRERAEQAEQRADTWHAAAQAANTSTHAAEVRARHAEDERDTWQTAAEQAEAAVQRVRDLIDSYPPGSNFARSGAQTLFRRVLDQEAGQ